MSLGYIWTYCNLVEDWKAKLEETFPYQYLKRNADQKLQSVQTVAQ